MPTQRETVVLLHGLWFGGWILFFLSLRLRRRGFDVRIFSYRSVGRDVEENAQALHHYLLRLNRPTVHLVGYSLGGLVIRALFTRFPAQAAGRVVTLGTPHGGSHAAQVLNRYRWGRAFLGHSAAALLHGAPTAWALPAREFGTIAGDLSVGAGRLLGGLPEPNDGTVAVAEASLKGARAVTLPVSHVGLVLAPQVAEHVARFLRSGRFDR